MTRFTEEEIMDIGETEYQLIDDPENKSLLAVKITSGPYKNLIYNYGTQITPVEQDDGIVLQYDINILTLPTEDRYIRKRIEKKKGKEYFAMLRMTGAILSELIEDMHENQEENSGSDNALDEFIEKQGDE